MPNASGRGEPGAQRPAGLIGEQNDLSAVRPTAAKQMVEFMKTSRTGILPQEEPKQLQGKLYR
ncbi:MAG: hypothetical protein AAGB26_06745 [Planctomycetota bacterium]